MALLILAVVAVVAVVAVKCGRSTSSSTPPSTAGRSRSSRSSTSTRERLGGLVDRSGTADRLIDELDRLAAHRGYPAVLSCDNGPELACTAMAHWAGDRVDLSFSPPDVPERNSYIKSFSGRLRDECLNIELFWSLAHARATISGWKTEYNHHRRHSGLGHQAPARYAEHCTHQ